MVALCWSLPPPVKGDVLDFIDISSLPVLLNTPKISSHRKKSEKRAKSKAKRTASHLERLLLVARTKPTRPRASSRARASSPERTTRQCSHGSNNGHNSRTCPARSGDGGVRLFGVWLTTAPAPAAMKKSASMSCIASSLGGGSGDSSPPAGGGDGDAGYVSDNPAHASCLTNGRAERKKGEAFSTSIDSFGLHMLSDRFSLSVSHQYERS